MDAKQIEDVIRQMDMQREAYLETFQKFHDMLTQSLASAAAQETPTPPSSPTPIKSDALSQRSRRQSLNRAVFDHARKTSTGLPTLRTYSESKATGEESDDEDDENLYVQTPLETRSHTEEALRHHLESHKFDEHGKTILHGVVDNPARLANPHIIHNRKGPADDRSHFSHYSVFDVGVDGSVLAVDNSHVENEQGRAQAIWQTISEINHPSKQRQAVGRITILREPSPILFGAAHYVFHEAFDPDELFRHLVDASTTSASMHRTFDTDERRRRSFVFNFEYFTLVGKDCVPMDWQIGARPQDLKPGFIAISRCSSVVALSLHGAQIMKIKNPSRRATNHHGAVYDTFSPWQVLNLQCYPDWRASLDVHDSTKHYVNGPDAFLNTLLGEYRDAQHRIEDVCQQIARLVTPSLKFMFDSNIRDKLLFEDNEYTMARRYFWAHQTLGIMNESIKAMIDAYEDNLTSAVWDGTHKTLWPLPDETSARSVFYRKKMASLKSKFEIEIQNLRTLMKENEDRKKGIIDLREALFTGTSIQESRKSVMMAETTVQQGHNIKLLTLVSIFFLPLTFVTSVFGMTNMPTNQHYWMFGIVLATVCVPFFVLIGSLNTNRGMDFWRSRTKVVFARLGSVFAWLARGGRKNPAGLAETKSFDSESVEPSVIHVPSRQEGFGARIRRWSTTPKSARQQEAEVEGMQTRGIVRRATENGPVAPTAARPQIRRSTVPTPPPSSIAGMWVAERRSQLRYAEAV